MPHQNVLIHEPRKVIFDAEQLCMLKQLYILYFTDIYNGGVNVNCQDTWFVMIYAGSGARALETALLHKYYLGHCSTTLSN